MFLDFSGVFDEAGNANIRGGSASITKFLVRLLLNTSGDNKLDSAALESNTDPFLSGREDKTVNAVEDDVARELTSGLDLGT